MVRHASAATGDHRVEMAGLEVGDRRPKFGLELLLGRLRFCARRYQVRKLPPDADAAKRLVEVACRYTMRQRFGPDFAIEPLAELALHCGAIDRQRRRANFDQDAKEADQADQG